MAATVEYVFLASTAYSGSTLLSALLGMHPEIATVSDVSGTRRRRTIATYRCSCGELMLECPFWQAVRAAMLGRGVDDFELADFRLGFDYRAASLPGRLLTGPLRFGWVERARDALAGAWPAHARRMRAIGERNRLFAEAVLSVTGKRVFVDASKERRRAAHLARYLGADVRVIHLARDPRGVVESTLRRGKRPEASPVRLARSWASTHESILRDLRRFTPERRILVRYEDLCRTPDAVLAGLFRFCGVDPDVPVAELVAAGRVPTQHLLGNRMRLDGIGPIRLDERWRDALDDRQAEAILAATAPTYRRLYGVSR
ncbi:MAG TPA: sulfotransferase [Candidatus Limnocylindrales bacterium]|nr:sulfotransferase [Candidatus Limnocylindrales bacterium]